MIRKNQIHHWIVQALQADLGQDIAIICRNGKITRAKQLTLFHSQPLTAGFAALHITSHWQHQAAVTVVCAEAGIPGCAAAKLLL